MIFIYCGSIMVFLSILFQFIKPRKKIKIYGYYTYLASLNDQIYLYAQKQAKLYLIICGVLQIILGSIININHLNRLLYIWIFLEMFMILGFYAFVEDRVTNKLKKNDQFPQNYKNLDDRERKKRKLVKGLRQK